METKARKSFLSYWRRSICHRSIAFVCCVILLNTQSVRAWIPPDKPTSYPGWWFSRGVILPKDSSPSPTWNNGHGDYPPSDDYAIANVGQLKQIATKAAAEMNSDLPGGAGDAINNLVNAWNNSPQPGVARDDFATLNLGQLKTVARPFYDRLIAVCYTNSYPWLAAAQGADDWATVNLGQLKSLFSFDLAYSSANNGLPDWWQRYYFGQTGVDPNSAAPAGNGFSNIYCFLNGINPTDWYNGQTVVLALVSGGNQTGLPGAFLPQPIVVSVTKGDGTPWTNGPVTFTTASNLGGFAAASDGSPSPSLTVQVLSNGTAAAYFEPAASVTGTGTATAGSHQTTFTVSGYDPTAIPGSVPALQASSSAPGQTTLSWSSNATNSTGVLIQRWTAATGWVTVGAEDIEATTFTDIAVPQGTVVAYRAENSNSQGQSAPSPLLSPSGADLETIDTDNDGLSDAEEIRIGTDPNNPDTDGDGVIDGMDLDPLDPNLTQPRVRTTHYAVIDLTNLGFLGPVALSDSLKILDVDPSSGQTRLWDKGQFTPVPDPPNFPPTDPSYSGPSHVVWNPTVSNDGELVTNFSRPGYIACYTWSADDGFTQMTYTCPTLSGFDNVNNYFGGSFITPCGSLFCAYFGEGYSNQSYGAGEVVTCGLGWLSTGQGPIVLGTENDLGTNGGLPAFPQGDDFGPTGASDGGLVVGIQWDYSLWPSFGPTQSRGAVWQNGQFSYLTTYNGNVVGVYPTSVNKSTPPMAVGSDHDPSTGYLSRAVVWTSLNSGWIEENLGPWNSNQGARTEVYGLAWQVNDRCEIVGQFQDANGNQLPNLWQNGLLVQLDEKTSGEYSDINPYALNNSGAVLAWATRNSDGEDAAVLLVPVDLQISNGQNPPQPVPEHLKYKVGAFTVANLNDTDGDGKPDDTEDNVPGEVDLMKLYISGYKNLSGQVKITVKSGSVKFWETSSKGTEIVQTNGAVLFDIPKDGMDKTIWIEATAPSQTVRDIEIWEGYVDPSGNLQDGKDKVRATAVWATNTDVRNLHGQTLWGDVQEPLKSNFQNAFGDSFGYWVAQLAGGAVYGYVIGFQFTVQPAGVGDEPNVNFEVTRQKGSTDWALIMATPPHLVANFLKKDPIPMPAGDTANDDIDQGDKSNFPKNDHIYSVDGPASVLGGVDARANVAQIIHRRNFNEFVRVSFNGQRPAGNTNSGSRCSPKIQWHSVLSMEQLNPNALGLTFGPVPGAPNESALGHIDNPQPPVRGR